MMMVGKRRDEMGEMINIPIPLSMGLETQTHSCTSTSMIPIFVDTNLDTHLALSAYPSETVGDLRAKIRKGHLSCFPHLGDIDVGALMVKRKSLFYHLVDSMLIGSAFHGLKGTKFLSVEISQPDIHIDQGGPRANITNLENKSLLRKHHLHGLQAHDKRPLTKGSGNAATKSMSDSMIFQKPSLLADGMDATQACIVDLHNGKLLAVDECADCIMEDHDPHPFLNPEHPVGTGKKIEAINSPPLSLNVTDGETGIPNTSQSWNVKAVPNLQNWRSVKEKKSKSVFEGSQVLEDCGQLSKSMQFLHENKERKGVAVRNTGFFKDSKNLGREDGQHEIPTIVTNGEVRNFFDEKSDGMVSDLQAGESPNLKKKTKSAKECSQVQKACGQVSNNIHCQTTSTKREENVMDNEGFAEECKILGGRDGNFGILMTNEKGEGERLLDGNSNGNVSDIQVERETKWKKGKLVAKCSQVKEGGGQFSNDIDSPDLVAAKDENVMINAVFGKESKSSGIGDETLPPNGKKKSKRKREELDDLNEDSAGCGLSKIQEKNRRKKMTMEGNNIVKCSSKKLLENFETMDFLSGQISRSEKLNVSKSVNTAMTLPGNNHNSSTEFNDEDILCTQLSTAKKHETSSRNIDDEFPPNTAGMELQDLHRKSDDARECIIEKKVNSKISSEDDSAKIDRKESKDLQGKVDDDARKYDTEKQVKRKRKMSSKHAILEYEQEGSAKDVNGETQITAHNPLLKNKCITTEETQETSVTLEENGQKKDALNVPVNNADISTHVDASQSCNITGKKKNKRSRNHLSRLDSPERVTKEQVPKDDIVINCGKYEGDESTPDASKEKRTHMPGENGGIAYLSTEKLKENAITDPGHIRKARGNAPIMNKEAYANSDTGMENRNNEKCDSGKKVKLSKTSPSKRSQERCVGADNRLIDEVVKKSSNSGQHAKDEMKKPKDTDVSSEILALSRNDTSYINPKSNDCAVPVVSDAEQSLKDTQGNDDTLKKHHSVDGNLASRRKGCAGLGDKVKHKGNVVTNHGFDTGNTNQSSEKKLDNDSASLKSQATSENTLHKSTHVAQLDTNGMSFTRKGSKERQCIANSTEKTQSGNQKVASERNIVENSSHKLKQAKSSATTDGFDRIQSSKEKQDDDLKIKKLQHKAEEVACNGNSTADSCHRQKRTMGFVTDNVYKDRQFLGEQRGIDGASRKLQMPKKTHDRFSVSKTSNKDKFTRQQEKVLEKPKGDKYFTKSLQSLFKSVNDESTEEENEIGSDSVNSTSESSSDISSDSLDSDGGSREKVSKCHSLKSQADGGPSTSGLPLSTAAGRKHDTGESGPIQSRFVHLLAKKTGLGELFKIASAQKKAQPENFSDQFVSTESPSTNMVLETQESQNDLLHIAHDKREPNAFPVTADNTKVGSKALNDKATKAIAASKSCLESTPKASGKPYSPFVENRTDNSVDLEAPGKGMPQMQQSGRRIEPRTRSVNKRTVGK